MTAFTKWTADNRREKAGTHGLRVIERGIYRGPHLFSARPMIRVQLDLGFLEQWPSSRIPDFNQRLLGLLPGLAAHGCSCPEAGGFARRLADGTWLGHVIEHVALELQSQAGSPVTRGKTRSVEGRPGVYNILFAYRDEGVGVAAGHHAIALVAALLPERLADVEGLDALGISALADPLDVSAILSDLRVRLRAAALGPTTQALVDAAERRGIPVFRLNDASLIQFGHGSRQKRIRASITGDTAQIAVDIAGNKDLAKRLLAEAGLPTPLGTVVRSEEEAQTAARRLGWPIVVKPLDGNHGRGVSTDVTDPGKLSDAFRLALQHSRRIIVERKLLGTDHRILVVAGKVVAVAERRPAEVVGDGTRSIEQLIAAINEDPRRGSGHEKVLTKIVIDDALRALLDKAGKTLTDLPSRGEVVRLRETANLSTGGTAIDRTDAIHPVNRMIAEQAAAVVGLDVCGIDFLTPDITRPVHETGGGIVEVNAAPGFRMHLEPSSGVGRDVAGPVIDMLFPHRRTGRIPIFAITGTNGKSTTARMLARILRADGRRVGLATTSGLYLDEQLIRTVDGSGPRSARTILRNPLVDAAVLETARGGILREGLGFDSADVGAVLNVTADHLGLKGIDTVEALADVKAVVVESVARRGHSILNADDPMCRRIARHARGTIVWFSMGDGQESTRLVSEHVQAGGTAVVREVGKAGGTIVVHRGARRSELLPVAAIPATLAGLAEFNTANVLAAAAMAIAYDISESAIREGLGGFTTSFEDSPGRLNVHDVAGRRVILDYAHNPAGLAALGTVIKGMRRPQGRVIGMVSIPGDRRDCDIIEMGRLAGRLFDQIVFREAPDGRGRPRGETNGLMSIGAMLSGIPDDRVHRIVDEFDAVEATLRLGAAGDLIILLPTSVEKVWQQVLMHEPEDAPVARAGARG